MAPPLLEISLSAFNSQHSTNLFLLSIWFDKIPNKTMVWYSTPVPRDSTLRLDARQGLLLHDPQGRLLSSTDVLVDEVAYAFMNDIGNFLLLRTDSTSLWETFRNAAVTILPAQTIEIDGSLISRTTPTNFSLGRFYANMKSDGNFVLNTKTMPSNFDFEDEYYNSYTSDQNASNSGFRVVFSERASIFVLKRNGQQLLLTPRSLAPPSDNYYRAALDFDGVLTKYYHLRDFRSIQGGFLA